jgi:hypothetical protein
MYARGVVSSSVAPSVMTAQRWTCGARDVTGAPCSASAIAARVRADPSHRAAALIHGSPHDRGRKRNVRASCVGCTSSSAAASSSAASASLSPIPQIADEFGVSPVVDGSIRRVATACRRTLTVGRSGFR